MLILTGDLIPGPIALLLQQVRLPFTYLACSQSPFFDRNGFSILIDLLTCSQAVLPFSFALSFFFLATRYRLPHYAGAVIVLFGIGVCLWPQLEYVLMAALISFVSQHTWPFRDGILGGAPDIGQRFVYRHCASLHGALFQEVQYATVLCLGLDRHI